jgi:ABC-2 type transport system ATP-binding protein
MAEADELCERIAIVDHGRILAIGSPDELRHRVQRESIFRLELDRLDGGVDALARLPGVVSAAHATDADKAGERQTVSLKLVLEEDGALGGVVGALGGLGAQILALRKSEPSLEDVFVELVGRGFDDDGSRPSDPGNGRHPPGQEATPPRTLDQAAHEAGEPAENELV